MGFRRPGISSTLATLACLAASVSAGPLGLNVVYPHPDQTIARVDSMFIFGSVAPGAKITVNGVPAVVHKGGGWLAFVPVGAGRFPLAVRAEKGNTRDTVTVMISLPEVSRISFDSLMILPQSLQPAETVFVQPTETIDLAFDGTPFGRAFCIVKPYGDTILMIEEPPSSRPAARSVFDRTEMDETIQTEAATAWGHYVGACRVPVGAEGPLKIVYHLEMSSALSAMAIDGLSTADSIALAGLARRNPTAAVSLPVPVIVTGGAVPTVVEFTDSVTTIRTGPRRGYLTVFQPAGIRAEMAGRTGHWIKIRLAESQYGWIPDTAATVLPAGTPLEPAVISSLQTRDGKTLVSISADISRKVPYRIEERPAENTITVYFYGAVSNTDWIRYDSGDSLIDLIGWSQSQADIYALTIHMNKPPLWGYDARYEKGRFRLDIRKRTGDETAFAHLRFVIDPGHAPEPGAIGPTGLAEKDVNLAIAMKLKAELEHRGAEAILTRSGTQGISLYDRPKLALRERADIFISIHNNALPDGVNPFVNNGVSTYFYHPHSEPLARAVQARLAGDVGLNDFGLFQANLAVTRPTQYPAILIEGAFIMVPDQEAKLKTNRFQAKLARAIADGLSEFLAAAATAR